MERKTPRFTYRFWQDMYDQRRVAELAAESRLRAI